MTAKLTAFHDVQWGIGEHVDGLFVRKDQNIPTDFLDQLKDERHDSKAPAGEYHKIASIPVVVVEKWLKEGFDIWRETPQAILKKLRQEDLSAFITTSKSI